MKRTPGSSQVDPWIFEIVFVFWRFKISRIRLFVYLIPRKVSVRIIIIFLRIRVFVCIILLINRGENLYLPCPALRSLSKLLEVFHIKYGSKVVQLFIFLASLLAPNNFF